MSPNFNLRFPVADIPDLAAAYSYEEDDTVVDIGAMVKSRGYMKAQEFQTIGDWKTERSKSRRAKNTQGEIEEITGIALSAKSERVRIGVLLSLSGVSWATASVILHLCHRDPYPLLDIRAMWSLGVAEEPHYTFDIWMAYVSKCRELSQKSEQSMRTVDRALWQFSKDNQGPL